MKKVLVLGAGMVSKPLVRYLLDHNFFVTMASRTISKAEKIIDNHSNGRALELNVKDQDYVENLISESDLTVSLLPYAYHVMVAKFCIKHKKHLVTTSYDSDEMKKLGDQVRSKLKSGVGVLGAIINEKPFLLCVVTDDLIKSKNLKAGEIIKRLAKYISGGGGGKPHMAQAGGKDTSKLELALEKAKETVEQML